jgi:hypothetical protein
MAGLTGYHKADKLREDNTAGLTGALSGQTRSIDRGQHADSCLPEISKGVGRVLQSVGPAARDHTANPDLNRGEYEVDNHSVGSD